MLTQSKILIKLELCNLYGWNVLRFSRDKKARKKSLGILAVGLFVLAILMCYVGGLSYGLCSLGLSEVVPAYLITISGMLIFVFGMLKAGSVVFRKEGHDILCALPLSRGVVPISRLCRMYVENLLMTLAVLLPGIGIYVWNVRPAAAFYWMSFLGIWSIPLLPMAAAILIGTLITGISSRMRHKSLVATGLSIFFVLVILYGSFRLSAMEGEMDPQMWKNLSTWIMGLLEKVYPPAVWLGTAMTQGDLSEGMLCTGFSVAVFAGVAAGTALCFEKICRNLFGSYAKHDYRMGELKANSMVVSLCKREFQRYFSSSIYVTNTIIGPIMGCVLCGGLLVTGTESLEKVLPFPVEIGSLIPFVIAGVFCMMTTTATSISMEGKNWWIVKSLPLTVKNILDAKILMNLLLLLPFYLLSELFLIFALKPGVGELFWQMLLPAVLILFSCVYGITVNLYVPVMEWDNEVRIVKQSASALAGGMGGFLLAVLCAIGVCVVPPMYAVFLKAGVCLAVFSVTVLLYRHNNHYDICGKI